jgi:predicted alpha/beta hydrolase family esterase
MINYYNIPGLGNSGPEHWQTYFESRIEGYRRIEQKEWDAPACEDWISTINECLEGQDLSNVVLVGHSLGCATIAHFAARYGKHVRAALLVAPSDLEAPAYTFPAVGFDPIPLQKINFKTIVVASTNDPWVSLERARYFADCWGSDIIEIGAAGHINAASGHGPWDKGLEILKSL